MKFAKPALTLPGLLAKLQARGLQVPDEAQALHYLRFIGYYRLSAYAVHFQQILVPGKPFLSGTTFQDVLDLYSFDRELRLLILDAIERIEVAVRNCLAGDMSTRYNNPHWFMEARHFDQKWGYISQFLSKVEQDTQRSQETFISHYKTKYTEPCLPPAWMVAENLTLGALSRMITHLNLADRKAIAAPFGCDEQFLLPWLHSLTYLRNLCAHHARLWNRVFSIKPPIAKRHAAFLHHRQRDTLYALAVVLFELIQVVAPCADWHHRLKALLAKHPRVPLSAMGFPANWSQEPFWNPPVV